MKKRTVSVAVLLHAAFLCLSPLSAQEANIPPLWREAIGGFLTGKPAAQAGTVVTLTDGGGLSCHSSQGRQLWHYFAGGRLTPFVSRSREGTSYICRTNGALIAVNRSGRELWRKRLSSPLSAPVVVGWDGRIFVPSGRELFCMTAAGYPLWTARFETPIARPPVPDLSGGILVMTESLTHTVEIPAQGNKAAGGRTARDTVIHHINHFGRSHVYRVSQNLEDSPPRFVFPVNFPLKNPGDVPPESSPPLAAEVPPGEISPGEVSSPGAVGILYGDGKMEIRERQGPGMKLPPLPSPALAVAYNGGRIAASLSSGTTTLLVPGEENFAWTGDNHLSPGDTADGTSMIFDERGIYVLSASGATGFADDGRRLWILRLKGSVTEPVFSDDGIVYSGGRDWILYAYKMEERIKDIRSSIYGPESEGSYGMGEPAPSFWGKFAETYTARDVQNRLSEIRSAEERGDIGVSEAEYVSSLREIAASGLAESGNPRFDPAILAPDRAEALRLLSYIGSRETIPFLAKVFSRDKEPAVKAAAAAAIGRIGVDPEGYALSAFSAMAFPPGLVHDEALLSSIAAATGSLCRFSGPPLSDDGLRILLSLGQSGMPRSVQTRANREIESFR